MRCPFPAWLTAAAIVCVLAACATATDHVDDSDAASKLFADPPREYSTGPLWVWNDLLSDDQIRGTLQDLAGQRVRQVFVHPRPGLMTPYLGESWFRLWKVALDEAEKLDMNVWIYDENSYPSGFAGGLVPEQMPQSRGRGLVVRERRQPPELSEDTLGVYLLEGDRCEQITDKIRRGEPLPEGRYAVATLARAQNSPWHADRCYVDLLYPGVTEKFLDVTLAAYRREIGDQFGKRVPGSFTDEPNLRPAGGLPWTTHLPQAFQHRWGYSLLDHLPSLTRPIGNWKQVRHDYFQLLLDQYIEHWGKPYYDWCSEHGLAFTGHYWDHEWPRCGGVPDNMAMNAWQHIPGIDCLMNQYREDTHAQFGNVRMVKETQSVCNQLGRRRFLCEIYGAGGWDLRFEDMKRIGDWLGVLGVNLFNEHLSYVTLRGARKADHPQSFSYHEPWWDSYHVMAGYLTRLATAMSVGEQQNRILVIEPTASAWMYQADAEHADQLDQIGKTFFDLLMRLERAQVEYDIGCEDVIARHGGSAARASHASGRPAEFVVGQRAYSTVVLPPLTETLTGSTLVMLERFAQDGGRILCCGPAPPLVDARPSQRAAQLARTSGWKQVEPDALADVLRPTLERDGLAIHRDRDDPGILFHHRRRLADGDLLLLVNTSSEAPSRGTVAARARGVQQWDLFSGSTGAFPFEVDGGTATLSYDVPPCGSLLLFLSHDPLPPGRVAAGKVKTVSPSGTMQMHRLEANVLTVDYVDLAVDDEVHEGIYYYRANQLAWQKAGLPGNPWDSAVQYRDELISRDFPAESGFELTYRFSIDGAVPKSLWVVVERPDLYRITCNDVPVNVTRDAWWLDRSFGKVDIAAAARSGENRVTLQAQPLTVFHEIAAAYILGDFSLRPTETGFVIVPATAGKVEPGWNQQGMPFYPGQVAYRQSFDVQQLDGRYRITVPRWYGSVAKVLVNDKLCGHLVSQPWRVDVTDAMQTGRNIVEVVVVGTLKNTLGPHHTGAVVGSAWPRMFQTAPESGPPPGGGYDTISYGLFEPIQLECVRD